MDGGLRLEWNAEAGRSYKIAVADSLSGPFLPLDEVHPAAAGTCDAVLSVDFSGRQMYFQVIQLEAGGAD